VESFRLVDMATPLRNKFVEPLTKNMTRETWGGPLFKGSLCQTLNEGGSKIRKVGVIRKRSGVEASCSGVAEDSKGLRYETGEIGQGIPKEENYCAVSEGEIAVHEKVEKRFSGKHKSTWGGHRGSQRNRPQKR